MGKSNSKRVIKGGRKAGQGSKWIRRSTRLAIYHRDGFACVCCGAGAEESATLTLDHLVACEIGGSNDPSNLVTMCRSCNSSKQDKTARQWYRALRAQGINANAVRQRIARRVAKPIDRAEGRRLEQLRKAQRA